MQAAKLPDLLNPWPKIKMIGISKNNLDAELFQYVLRNALYRRESSDRHEYWSLYHPMRRDERSDAGRALPTLDLECEGHWLDCRASPAGDEGARCRLNPRCIR